MKGFRDIVHFLYYQISLKPFNKQCLLLSSHVTDDSGAEWEIELFTVSARLCRLAGTDLNYNFKQNKGSNVNLPAASLLEI